MKLFLKLTLMASTSLLQSSILNANPAPISVLKQYADIALLSYESALNDARSLDKAINKFAKNPTRKTFAEAKEKWLLSRESYGQTEIFRLSGGPIDAEQGWVAEAYGNLEGQLNAWPLDESMIDYTLDADGKRTSGNIVDTIGIYKPGGPDAKAIDIKTLNAKVLSDLNENGGEANVATGYHAIEFLLWGQDQDYSNFVSDKVTNGPLTAGQRPLSDFTSDKFSHRRLAYLKAASEKIVTDLQRVTSAWKKTLSKDCNKDASGCYRAALLGTLTGVDKSKNINSKEALKQILSGMGVFIKSELANERIAVAVLTPSEEDEHSCFSDNTHRDIATNYQGFVNVLKSQYGGKTYGKSFYKQVDKETRMKIDSLTKDIEGKIKNIDILARNKWHFDYQILKENNAEEIKSLKNQLRNLGDIMVDVAKAYNISLTKSDVTDVEETKI